MRLSSRLRALCSVVVLTVLSIGPLTSPANADSATPRPHVTLGVFEPDSGETLADHLRSYTSVAGEAPEVVNYFTDWNPKPFPAASVDVIAATGATPLISWLPTTYANQHSTNLPGMLSSIAGGADDDYIRAWATAAKSFGSTIYLRLAHEMNGGWYAWGRGVNGNTAADYVAMYRHVHDIFEQVGATNVQWVWTPNAMWNTDTSNPEPFYPGDAYVDVVGLDGYNWGTDGTGSWVSFSSIFSLTLQTLPSFAADKPVWIVETGSTEHGGDKAAWLLDMFQTLISDQRISGLIYFDTVGTADWRLATSTESVDAYGQGVAALRAAEAPAPSTAESTSPAPTAAESSTAESTSPAPTAAESSTAESTSPAPTAAESSTAESTSPAPTAAESSTAESSTAESTSPAPTAAESSTAESTTPAPTMTESSTAESTTPAPTMTESSTAESTSPAPTMTESSTAESTSPAPSTAESSTAESSTPAPTTAESSTAESSTAESSTAESTSPAPTTAESSTPESTSPAPTTAESSTPESTSPAPGMTESTSSGPATTESNATPTASPPTTQPTVKVAQLAAHTKKKRSVRVSGRVPSGAAVRIARRWGGHWHRLRIVHPNRRGHYATKVRLPRAKVTLRVQVAPSTYRIVRVTVR